MASISSSLAVVQSEFWLYVLPSQEFMLESLLVSERESLRFFADSAPQEALAQFDTGAGAARRAAPAGFGNQCDIKTGRVISLSNVRVTPPSAISFNRECP